MARSSWRQRSDGIYQIVGEGRRLRGATVALTTLLAVAMIGAMLMATLVYVVIGFPLLIAVTGFLLVRRASRPAAPPATVLTLAQRNRSVALAARDTGA